MKTIKQTAIVLAVLAGAGLVFLAAAPLLVPPLLDKGFLADKVRRL